MPETRAVQPLIRNKNEIWLWLIGPVVFGAAYPFVKESPAFEWLETALAIYVLFFSVVIHEVCHGLAAAVSGDMTAADAGRLTFNPIRHFSIVGSFIVPLVLWLTSSGIVFGWAKPVPFNPMGLRRLPRDNIFTTLAGPFSNFALGFLSFFSYVIIGFIFNRVFPEARWVFDPMKTPIDLFSGLTLEPIWYVLFEIFRLGILINFALGIFNLIPFPPLDGHWLLGELLPKSWTQKLGKLRVFSFIFLIIAIQLGLLQYFFYPLFSLFIALTFIANFVLL